MEIIRLARKIGESMSIFDAIHHIPDIGKDFKWLGYRVGYDRRCYMYMEYQKNIYKVITWFPTEEEYILRVEECKDYSKTKSLNQYCYVVDYCKKSNFGEVKHERQYYEEKEYDLARQAKSNMGKYSQLYKI